MRREERSLVHPSRSPVRVRKKATVDFRPNEWKTVKLPPHPSEAVVRPNVMLHRKPKYKMGALGNGRSFQYITEITVRLKCVIEGLHRRTGLAIGILEVDAVREVAMDEVELPVGGPGSEVGTDQRDFLWGLRVEELELGGVSAFGCAAGHVLSSTDTTRLADQRGSFHLRKHGQLFLDAPSTLTDGFGSVYGSPGDRVGLSHIVVLLDGMTILLPRDVDSADILFKFDQKKLSGVEFIRELNGNGGPAERFAGLPSTFTGLHLVFSGDDGRVDEAEAADGVREGGNVGEVTALAEGAVEPQAGDGKGGEGSTGHSLKSTRYNYPGRETSRAYQEANKEENEKFSGVTWFNGHG